MWAHKVDEPEYGALLDSLERSVPGSTTVEPPRAW